MKKLKKSTGLTVALLIYVSATAAYFLPRNTEISNTEKYVTVIASYVIVLALWLVLRKKEELQRKRREEDKIKRKQDEKTCINRMPAYWHSGCPCAV